MHMIVILKGSILNRPWCFHIKCNENQTEFSVILIKNQKIVVPSKNKWIQQFFKLEQNKLVVLVCHVIELKT